LKSRLITLSIITLTLASCTLGRKGVRLAEMGSQPNLRLKGNELLLNIENSRGNSALSIYKIQPTIDQTNNIILLRGFQAPGKKFRSEFKIRVKNIDPIELPNFKIYWVDPDDHRTELHI
jgi:hypothetical protein